MKNIPDSFVNKLKNIFNHSLSLEYFPDKIKTAILKPIKKLNTDHSDPLNYRPISLLEVPRKILEKLISNRLRKYLEDNKTLPDTQHSFRRKRGTDTAITTIYEAIAHHTASKDQCYVILSDVSRHLTKYGIMA